MGELQMKAARFEGVMEISGSVETVFPLFSPLGEKLWVPGWNPELLYPPGAEWEEGLIFRTVEKTGQATWVVSALDQSTHMAEYHRIEPGRYLARVGVRCTAPAERMTRVFISYDYFGLSESGNREIAAMTEEDYASKMRRWTDWIHEYLGGA